MRSYPDAGRLAYYWEGFEAGSHGGPSWEGRLATDVLAIPVRGILRVDCGYGFFHRRRFLDHEVAGDAGDDVLCRPCERIGLQEADDDELEEDV